MKTLKLNHRIKASYLPRKNAQTPVYSIVTVKAYNIATAIERAKMILKIDNKTITRMQVIDINGTPAHLVNF